MSLGFYSLSDEQKKDLSNRYDYHPPKNEQPQRYEIIRSIAKHFALVVSECCPDSRERSTALTKIDEAMMFANASIARNE